MQAQFLTENFAVSPQISVADLEQAKELGVSTIVCNRPDGETPDQTPAQDIAQAAEAAGMDFHFIPMMGAAFTQKDVDRLREAMSNASGKVLAYCRSGNRSSILWQASQ